MGKLEPVNLASAILFRRALLLTCLRQNCCSGHSHTKSPLPDSTQSACCQPGNRRKQHWARLGTVSCLIAYGNLYVVRWRAETAPLSCYIKGIWRDFVKSTPAQQGTPEAPCDFTPPSLLTAVQPLPAKAEGEAFDGSGAQFTTKHTVSMQQERFAKQNSNWWPPTALMYTFGEDIFTASWVLGAKESRLLYCISGGTYTWEMEIRRLAVEVPPMLHWATDEDRPIFLFHSPW